MRQIALRAALLALSVSTSAHAGDVVFTHGFEPGFVFVEPFVWKGNHAASIHSGNSSGGEDHHGNTVWWNEDDWDAHGDTGYLATAMPAFPPIGNVTGYHLDVHKAISADPRNGNEDNKVVVIGGDGSPGIGVMRLDYQGISSSRLRNPMLVSESLPGVVKFYAPKFVTTGHWWEISLTPATSIVSGSNTAVPSQVARTPFEDSLNFVAIGHDDIPCSTGWHATFDVHRSIGGVEQVDPMVRPSIADYPSIDPSEKMKLVPWRVEFRPSGVDLYADMDDDGSVEHVYHYTTGVPWPEVYVALLGVAYQADHHPQNDACYQGLSRELVWRNVEVRPVKYARTSVAPRNTTLENVQRTTGWLGFDTRDVQRHGAAVDGIPQPNPWEYIPYGDMAFASIDLRVFGHAQPPSPQKTLTGTLDAAQAASTRVRLVYDIKGRGNATLVVNGQSLGALPGPTTLAYFAAQTGDNLLFEWAHRSIAIPAGRLHAGSNTLQFSMTGEVVFDRLHLEFVH
jgi:hypothetical protein